MGAGSVGSEVGGMGLAESGTAGGVPAFGFDVCAASIISAIVVN